MGVPPPRPRAIKVEEQGKRGRWKAIKVWEYRQNKNHGIYRVNGGKEYKVSRPGGLERVCGGEKVIIRARERKEEKPICSSRLSRSRFTLSRAYKSCFACRTLISNWIDRCFGQHLWNSVHSLSRDNPRIPTNTLSGSQQPPLLWGQWLRTKFCSKLTRPLRPCLIQTEITFQLHRTWRGFCWRYNLVPLIRRLSVTSYTHACL